MLSHIDQEHSCRLCSSYAGVLIGLDLTCLKYPEEVYSLLVSYLLLQGTIVFSVVILLPWGCLCVFDLCFGRSLRMSNH